MGRSRKPSNYAKEAGTAFLFDGLTEERVAELLSMPGVCVEHYAAGQEIRSRAYPVSALGIVLFGYAKVLKSGTSGRMPMSMLRPGDLLGAAALFSGESEYVADIRADRSVWILSVPEETLLAMMREEDRVMRNYLGYLTGRIRFLSEKIDAFAEWDTGERLMRVLRMGAVDGVFRMHVSMKTLAESISVSRATIYRALDGLEKKGWIRRDGRTIEILKEESE